MKTLKNLLLVCLFLIVATSCQKSEKEENSVSGQVQFGFTSKQMSSKSAVVNSSEVRFTGLIVSIEDLQGNVLFDAKQLKLYNFNGEYISEPLSLKEGKYKVSKFLVIDSINSIYYATPLKSGELAHLVNNPLPIEFSVNKDSVTKISPEVINIKNQSPEAFGVAAFGIYVQKTFDFLLGIMVYDEAQKTYQFTTAHIQINANNTKVYEGNIENRYNKLTLNAKDSLFNIVVTKDGYVTYATEISKDSLIACFNHPLNILLMKKTNNLNDGLVAYYPFNGNANDESGFGNNGTVYGAALTNDRFGNTNKAYSFNGIDNYILVNNNTSVANTNFSYSVWVNYFDMPIEAGVILEFGSISNSSTYGQIISLNNQYCNTNSWVITSGNTDGSRVFMKSENTPFPEFNKWHHVVLTRDNQFTTLYVDNNVIFKQETNNATPFYSNPFALYIGTRCSLFQFFNGAMDEFRIYNRVLSKEEISQLFSL